MSITRGPKADSLLSNDATSVDSGVDTSVYYLPDGSFLMTGEFTRLGDDLLITNPAGEQIVVEGYFSQNPPPTLMLQSGAGMTPDMLQSFLHKQFLEVDVAGPEDAVTAAGNPLEMIGTVKFSIGKITAINKDGEERSIKRGDPVYEGDEIRTASNGLIKIEMVEGTKFQLGKNARAVLDKLDYDPAASEGEFGATILTGAFRYVSGKIAKVNPGEKHTDLKTPTATVGIRGSELDGNVDPDNGNTTLIHTSGVLDIRQLNNPNEVVTLDTPGQTTQVTLTGISQPRQATPQEIQQAKDALPPRGPTPQEQEAEEQEQQNGEEAAAGSEGGGDETGEEGNGEQAAEESSEGEGDPEPDPDQEPEEEPDQETEEEAEEGPEGGPEDRPRGDQEPDGDQPSEGGDDQQGGEQQQAPTGRTARGPQRVEDPNSDDPNGGDSFDQPVGPDGPLPEGPVPGPVEPTIEPPPLRLDDQELPNAPPIAINDIVNTSFQNSVDIDVLANDFDPDQGDVLDVVSVNTTGTQGSVSINADGTINYDPGSAFTELEFGQTATDTFSYTIEDVEGATSTATVTVTITGPGAPPNNDPIATDDSAVVNSSASVDIAVLNNDVDPDEDNLVVESVGPTSQDGSAVSINANGTVAYTPGSVFANLALGQTATDTFQYTVVDGKGGSSTATVTVNLTGSASDDIAIADEDGNVLIDVLANDADGNPLTITAINGNPVSESGSPGDAPAIPDLPGIDPGSDPGIDPNIDPNLEPPLDPTNPDPDPIASPTLIADGGTRGIVTVEDGQIRYNPAGQFNNLGAGETGTDTFTYTVTDSNGTTSTASVTVRINGSNDNPIAIPDIANVNEDSISTPIAVLTNDIDLDTNDVLTITSVTPVGNTQGTAIFGVVGTTPGANDLIVYTPAASFNSLAAGESLVETFTYTISDGKGGTSTALLNITVTGINDAPTAVDDNAATNSNVATIISVLANDTDPDTSNVLAVSVVDTSNSQGSAVVNADGTISYTPGGTLLSLEEGQTAVDTFTYTVTDGQGGTDTATVSVTVTGAASGAAAVVDINSLDGSTGFITNTLSGAEVRVSSAGDLNGDGLDDFLIGSPKTSNILGDNNSGQAFVIFGNASNSSPTLDINNTINTGGGFQLEGLPPTSTPSSGLSDPANLGVDLEGIGDFNGDGINDILIGADGTDSNAGRAYIVFGKPGANPFGSTFDLNDFSASDGINIDGLAPGSNLGATVSGLGDINGDGYADIALGTEDYNSGQGVVHVIFGSMTPPSAINVTTLNGNNGFEIRGKNVGDALGASVESAGDFNGDGLQDFIISADFADGLAGTDSGEAYLIFGSDNGFPANIDLNALSTTQGFKISGANAGDQLGLSVSTAGDFNGDGFSDVLVGAYGANSQLGQAYILFGNNTPIPQIDLGAPLAPNSGLTILPENISGVGGLTLGSLGARIDNIGDVNGDGFDDVVLGVPYADVDGFTDNGLAYVLFGGPNFSSTTLDLNNLQADQGLIIEGIDINNTYLGQSVAGAGDINGDGIDDILLSAGPGEPEIAGDPLPITNNNTQVVAIFGQVGGLLPTILGDAADNNLVGTNADERLIGGLGNDILNGAGGDDILIGGAGNDILVFDPNTDTLLNDGGGGQDTLRIDGNGITLNLTAKNLTAHYQLFTNLEAIDLTGSGNNTVALDSRDLIGFTDSRNTLRIDGNVGDQATVAGNWTFVGTADQDGDSTGNTHDVYRQNGITLIVDRDVNIQIEVTSVDTTIADGVEGFGVVASNAGPNAALSEGLSGIGDFNGDGIGDFLISAPGDGNAGDEPGEAYVVFGTGSGFAPTQDLAALDGSNGFRFTNTGTTPVDFGDSVSSGDFNGDGLSDIAITVQGENKTHVLFGTQTISATVDAGILNGSTGFTFQGGTFGPLNYNAGADVAFGDFNGDGLDDVIISETSTVGTTGAATVIFGRPAEDALPANNTGNSISGNQQGFRITGATDEMSVSSAGDFNGDGVEDLILGVENNNQAFIIFGQNNSPFTDIDLTTLDGINGFQIQGENAGDAFGTVAKGIGDLNGDGFDDIYIAAEYADRDANNIDSGKGYVIFGDAGSSAPTENISALAPGEGIVILGANGGDKLAAGVGVSDFNGDGLADLLVGAYGADTEFGVNSGRAYLIEGNQTLPSTIDLRSIDDEAAPGSPPGSTQKPLAINGSVPNGDFGASVASSDVDGDGLGDLIIGAPLSNNQNGNAAVILARAASSRSDDPDLVLGSVGNDSNLIGSGNFDRIVAGAGDDQINGFAGGDAINAGSGDDKVIFDGADLVVDGGSGRDVLEFVDDFTVANFSNLNTTRHYNQFINFEEFDLSGGNVNVSFDLTDFFNLTDSRNTLRIRGGSDDQVNVLGNPVWSFENTFTDGGETFDRYRSGNAVLELDSDIQDNLVVAGASLQGLLNNAEHAILVKSNTNGQMAGTSLTGVNDFNNDGFDDLLIGSPGTNQAQLIFGNDATVPTSSVNGVQTLNLEAVNGATTTGILFNGSAGNDTGEFVSNVGDFNRDGLTDIAVSADGTNSNDGLAHVLFGDNNSAFSIDLNTLAPEDGFNFVGTPAAADEFGDRIVSIGDIDGDGTQDLGIGAPDAGSGDGGAAFLRKGGTPPFSGGPNEITQGSISSYNGKEVSSTATTELGDTIAAAGDLNGDGFDDFIIADSAYGSDKGIVKVFFGSSEALGTLAPSTLDFLAETNVLTITTNQTNSQIGSAAAGVGDFNGDGFDDIVIGAPYADVNGTDSGSAYVILGGTTLQGTTINVSSDLNGTNGFAIHGLQDGAQFGSAIAAIGDFRADGRDDFIIGAPGSDGPGGNDVGSAFMLFGTNASGFSTFDLRTLDGNNGFFVEGIAAGDRLGSSVSGNVDLDGDGAVEVILGAPNAGANNEGAAYIINGSLFKEETNALFGTKDNDILNGTAAGEVISGGAGNDVLNGTGGIDALYGGTGNDTLIYNNITPGQYDGGQGFDTLRIDGSGITLDLSTVPNNTLTSIETIDLNNTGPNTLILNQLETSNISGVGSVLFVNGSAGDQVQNNNTESYNFNRTVFIGGVEYDEFIQFNGSPSTPPTILRVQAEIEAHTTLGTPATPNKGAEYLLGSLAVGDGSQGFILRGSNTKNNEYAGRWSSGIGDVNGDGFEDFIVGGHQSSAQGRAYVMFGGQAHDSVEKLDDLASGDGSKGFVIDGRLNNSNFGRGSIAGGDINGDGISDIVISARNADGSTGGVSQGEVYVIYGRNNGSFGSSIAIGNLNLGTDGVRINGVDNGDKAGEDAVDVIGDVNGDGFQDIVIGAYKADSQTGEAYVLFGGSSLAATIELDNLFTSNGGDGSNGFVITSTGLSGAAKLGSSVAGIGDINGDGLDDFAIGTPDVYTNDNTVVNGGRTQVIFGRDNGFGAEINALDVENGDFIGNDSVYDGATVSGLLANGFAGRSVSGAGDVDGDGLEDFIIGAPDRENIGGGGRAYLIFGTSAGLPPDLLLDDLNTTGNPNGVLINTTSLGDKLGRSVSSAGDVNGDGFDDLIIGAPQADAYGDNTGEAYLLFGNDRGTLGTTISVFNLGTDLRDGLSLVGSGPDSYAGRVVSGIGDVNGDGYDDLSISSHFSDTDEFSNVGENYIVFGRDFSKQGTINGDNTDNTLNGTSGNDYITGLAGNDTLNGDLGNDILIGGLGNDILTGGGGADTLIGGAGDDIFNIDSSDRRIDGGSGRDTLQIDGLNLDLTAIADSVIRDVEVLDMTGGNADTLALNLTDVLQISDETDTLVVLGDNTDSIVSPSTLWGAPVSGQTLPEFAGVTFDLFQINNVKLFVDNEINSSGLNSAV